MATNSLVEPINTLHSVPVEPANGATVPEQSSPKTSLPEELISIPAFQGLLVGQPAAVSAPIMNFAKRHEGQLIQKHKDDLLSAGIGLYRSIAGDLGVLFNQSYISGEDLKTADKNGTLLEVAPSFDQINAQLASSGAEHPILQADMNALPTGPKTPGAPSISPIPPMAAAGSPAASPVPQRTVGAKLRNLVEGGPTSGPAPGEGRLLNSILKPVL